MALDLKIVQQSKKIKIDPARLKKKQESINPWDRPVFLKKTTLEKQPRNKQSKTVIKRIKKRESKGDQTGIKAGSNWDQKLGSKRDQTGIKLGSNLSSSSSNLNTTTTSVNKTDKNGYLDAVKIPEEIKKIGFRETQVEQISKIGKLSVEELETSLEHFSFDLGEGHIRAKTNPLNMLMGILRHGVYTSSEYLKEEETALENELRGLRERKKRRDDLLKEKQELLFEEWLEPKSKDEIVAIVPTPMNSNEFYMQGIHKELLFNHFVENEMELFKGFQQ